MITANHIKIFETEEFGIVLEFHDAEIADQFDDFLVNNSYENIPFKFEEGSVLYYFGKDISIASVEALYNQFQKENNIKTY